MTPEYHPVPGPIMLTARERLIATVTAGMVNDISMNAALRYQVFPGHAPEIEAYGWTEMYNHCAFFAEAVVRLAEEQHHSLDEFWEEWWEGKYVGGIFEYEVSDKWAAVVAERGGDVYDYDGVATAVLNRLDTTFQSAPPTLAQQITTLLTP